MPLLHGRHATTTVATVSGTTTAGTAYAVTGATNGQTSVITYNDNYNCNATAIVTIDIPSITGTLGICSGSSVALTGASFGTLVPLLHGPPGLQV
jgi:hypothetical protein